MLAVVVTSSSENLIPMKAFLYYWTPSEVFHTTRPATVSLSGSSIKVSNRITSSLAYTAWSYAQTERRFEEMTYKYRRGRFYLISLVTEQIAE